MQPPSINVAPSTTPQRTVVTIIIAVYLIIAGILTFCGSLALVGLGGIAGTLGSITSQSTAGLSPTEVAGLQQAQNAVASVQASSGLLVILGIVLLIVGIAYIVTGIGLFMVRPWAYTAAIAISALYIVITVLEAIVGRTGFTLTTLIFPIISLVVIIYFLTNEDTKRAFGRV